MKKYLNIKTIFVIISILIIIAGVITIYVKNFEKSFEYKAGTRIEIYIPNGYEKQDIIDIAKEIFNTDEMIFVEIEKLDQVAGIKLAEYSEEQLEKYLDKVSEKYEIERKKMEYHEVVIPETKIETLVKPYILPILFTTTLSLIYIIIKNIKSSECVKISIRIIVTLTIALGLYFSIIALFRVPVTIYTMPLALAIYLVCLLLGVVNKKCE